MVLKRTKRFLSTLILLGVIGILSFAHTESSVSKRVNAESADFYSAAKRNSQLKNTLRWSLGRRRQTGWALYVPLIQKTLGTEAHEDTVQFARSVYYWQKRKKLPANGIIFSGTLYSFIKHWQAKRIKPIVLAKEYQLLTAPITDFYDPTRETRLLKVEKQTYAAYKRMIAAALADKSSGLKVDSNGEQLAEDKFLRIISSYRSPAYQASLRRRQPGASRAQIAFRSPHFTGRALDIYVGGEPVTTRGNNRAIQVKTPAYRWLVKNADKFGFYNYFYEPWHWEYVGDS